MKAYKKLFLIFLFLLPVDLFALEWPGTIEKVAKGLENPSLEVKLTVIDRLSRYPLEKVEPLILPLMESDNIQLKTEVTRILVLKGSSNVIPYLINWLNNPEKEVRKMACSFLGQTKLNEAVEPLIRILGDPDSEMREYALRALSYIKNEDALTSVIARLNDSFLSVKLSAVDALYRYQDKRAVPPLIASLRDTEPEMRAKVAFVLGDFNDLRAEKGLLIALNDEVDFVRNSIIVSLGKLKSKNSISKLELMLSTETSVINKNQILISLGEIGGRQATEIIVSNLNSPLLQQTASFALSKIDNIGQFIIDKIILNPNENLISITLPILMKNLNNNMAPSLINLLYYPEFSVETKRNIIMTLGKIDHPEIIPTLLDITETENNELILEALKSLLNQAKMKKLPSVSLDLISRYAFNNNPDISKTAIQIVGYYNETITLDIMLKILREGTQDQKKIALKSIPNTNSPLYINPLMKIIQDNNNEMRFLASMAFAQMQLKESIVPLSDLVFNNNKNIDLEVTLFALGRTVHKWPDQNIINKFVEKVIDSKNYYNFSLNKKLLYLDAIGRGSIKTYNPVKLINLITTPNVILRRKLVEVLGSFYTPSVKNLLINILQHDEDNFIRGTAAWQLGYFYENKEEIIPVLQNSILNDSGWSVDINSVHSLLLLKADKSLDNFCPFLTTKRRAHFISNLVLLMGEYTPECAYLPLKNLAISHESSLVRLNSIKALVGYKNNKNYNELYDFLRNLYNNESDIEIKSYLDNILSKKLLKVANINHIHDDWVEIYYKSIDNGKLETNKRYLLILPDGSTKAGVSDNRGYIRVENIPSGKVYLEIPEL